MMVPCYIGGLNSDPSLEKYPFKLGLAKSYVLTIPKESHGLAQHPIRSDSI